jgi:hypothetical protein
MKAISVRQPWAWAIIYSTKDIENRGWPINYRGDILINAAKMCTKKEYESASIFCQSMGVSDQFAISNSQFAIKLFFSLLQICDLYSNGSIIQKSLQIANCELRIANCELFWLGYAWAVPLAAREPTRDYTDSLHWATGDF